MQTLVIGSYILLWVIVILLSLALFILYSHVGRRLLSSREGHALQGPDLETRITPQVLADLDGVRRTIGGPSAKPTLVLYLSITCAPCRELIDAIPEAIQRFGEEIQTIVIVRGDPLQVMEMTARLPSDVIVCADNAGDLITTYRIMVTPFGLSLDRRGVLRYKGVPGSDADNLSHFVSALLRAESSKPPLPFSTPESMLQRA